MKLEKQKLIAEIIQLAMAINYQTDYCVFVDFSGHVNWLDIKIAESKENYNKQVCTSHIVLKRDNAIERLTAAKSKLIEILETQDIETSDMDYEIKEIRHYIF